MSADAKGFRRQGIQDLFWSRTGLLLLVLVVVSGLSMLWSGSLAPGTLRNLVAALGTGTMVSAVVGFGQTLITASASQRAMLEPLVEESRAALRELSAEYRALNQEFFPTHVFEATAEPDPTFNNLMMLDLRATRHYLFRGFSGRHAAARLLLSHAERELRVVVADPTERTAIGGRARYLLRHQDADADYESVHSRLHEEIRIGLVGLYLARNRCSRIDLSVIADPPLDRVEMFDDSVWISLYSDVGGNSTLYPRTLRFSEGSFIYNMERAELTRIANGHGARHASISPDTTRREFVDLYHDITGARLSAAEFTALEERFHTFRREFSAAADIGS